MDHTKPLRGHKGSGSGGSGGSDLAGGIAQDCRREVGKWLREQRHAAGLTQDQLAEALGVTKGGSFISAIEVGRDTMPPARYHDFATILGLNEHDMGVFLLRYTNPWLNDLIHGGGNRGSN